MLLSVYVYVILFFILFFISYLYQFAVCLLYYYYFLNPRKNEGKKKNRNRKCWKDYCSGQSSNTKPSCNKTEINRNSKTEMRWNKKEVSLSSSELREILRPRSERNWWASLFMGPRDSKANGWKQYGFPVRRIWYSCGWQPFVLFVLLLFLSFILLCTSCTNSC